MLPIAAPFECSEPALPDPTSRQGHLQGAPPVAPKRHRTQEWLPGPAHVSKAGSIIPLQSTLSCLQVQIHAEGSSGHPGLVRVVPPLLHAARQDSECCLIGAPFPHSSHASVSIAKRHEVHRVHLPFIPFSIHPPSTHARTPPPPDPPKHTRAGTHARTQARTSTCARAHTHKMTHLGTHTDNTHIHTYTRKKTLEHSYTHTYTRATHARAYTHTHTHNAHKDI